MIFGTGVDIVEVFRMKNAVNKWGDGFLKKVFTDKEIGYSNSRRFAHQHFAARFAAKEAVIKAFGQPRKFPVNWTDIEVLNDKEGKPIIEFHGDALRLKKAKRVNEVIVSMSHSKNYAIANAILLKRNG
ncbi:MAG: holo-ACP synthase [Candidatus Omnitrophota bacterium]|nr:holo-ACP synthase [Candidatus Omnitrophota bacterium]